MKVQCETAWVHLRLRAWAWWDSVVRGESLPEGAWGERWAERLLRAWGCAILGRNVRPCRRGELDLVARHRGVILFVEVKTRRSEVVGRPLEAVNRHKRAMMRRCATHWLAQERLLGHEVPYRFDAVEVVGLPHEGVPRMRWIRGLDMEGTRAPDLF